MADYKLLTMLVIMASINIVLFLFQGGMTEANPEAPNLFNLTGSPAGTYIQNNNAGGYSMVADADDYTIETSDSVDDESGNLFTDTFKTINEWWNRQEARFGIMTGIVKQPYGFMEQIGIPSPISAGFGFIWYSLAVVLLIAFLRGGSQ